MLNISTDFKEALLNDNRDFQNRAVITLVDGTVLTVDNTRMMLGGNEIEDAVGDDNTFTALGSAIINSATLVLFNNDEVYSDYTFEDASVVIYTGLNLSGGLEELKKGTFIVDSASYGNATITLNLLDNLSKFDKPYSLSSLVFPASMRNVILDACNVCGVPLASSSAAFPHSNYIIESAPTEDSTTFREVISKCATIAGCFARCNVNGELELKWFDVDSLIARSNIHRIVSLFSQNIAVDDIVITQVKIVVTTKDENGNPVNHTYISGQDGYTIEISNNEFITESTARDVLNWLATQLIGLTFRPCNVTHLNDPSIEAGDVATVKDTKGVEHPILITRTNFNSGRPQTIVCGAESPSKNSSVQFSETSKAYAKVREQLKDERTSVQQAIEALSEKMDNAGGLYSTVVPQTGGGSITYYHNKPELDDSDIQLVISDVGITVTNDGGETWYGLTVDGQLIASIMNAIGINFDWGVGGELIIKNGDNETFYVNADTGEVRIVANSFSLTGTDGGTIPTIAGKTTRTIMNNANAYGLGWKVNHNSFTNESNGECWYHGYATDGTPANVDGWVYWNGQQVTIPRGYGINPNNTMPFDTVLYSVFRTSDSKYHDVVWTGTQWEGNTYNLSSGSQIDWRPSARAVWTWDEETDIILASYMLPATEGAIYGAQLFTPPKKYSELAEKAEYTLSQQLNDFATQVTEDIKNIEDQLDGVVDNWFYDYEPTLDNYPANEWTTDELKQDHIGDMFYDMSTGRAYRFLKYGTENLIKEPYYDTSPKTSNGITWVNNGDGTITANGTATATSYFTFHRYNQGVLDGLKAGKKYRLSLDVKTGRCSIYFAHYSGSTNLGEFALRDVNNTYAETEFTAWTDEYDGNAIALYIGSSYGKQTNTIITPVLVEKWTWQQIPDTDAVRALQLASEAKDTADHKRRVFITTPYVPYDQGDIWMQGTDGDILVCLESKTASESYSATDWGKLNKYTDEETTINIVEEKVNSIEIGGRNLLYDTNAPTLGAVDGDGARYWSSQGNLTNGTAEWVEIADSPVAGVKYGAKLVCSTTGGSSHGPVFYQVPAGEIRDFIDWKNGQTYTFSYYVKSSVAGAIVNTAISTTSYREFIAKPAMTIDTADKWVRYVVTFKYTGPDNANQLLWTAFQYNVVGTVYMCGFQLEIGNVATDWSEYPRVETTYSGRNLIHNTNNVDLSEHSTKPNINGFYNDGEHYGNIEYSSSGTTTASEHGIKTVVDSATYPFFRFGTASDTASTAEKNSTLGLEVGQQYTLSFDYEYKLYSGADTTNIYYLCAYLYYYEDSAWHSYEGKLIDSIYVAERGTVKSGRGFFTFTVPDANIYLIVRPYTITTSLFASGDYLELKNLKLEKGTDATDWSAAPEDIAGDITDVYVKSGGRNYLTGTGTPFVRAIGINDTHVNGKTQWNTYLDQTLDELGFAVGDKVTVSYDWEVTDVVDSKYGTFRLELFGKTSSSDYEYLAVLNSNITVSASNLSGHCTNTFTLNSTTIKGYAVVCRVDTMTATLKISNLKFEKGETESSWKVAPEDATMPASGANMLRGTDASKALDTGAWGDGTWRIAGSGTGTRTVIDIDDTNIPKIKHGWKITATSVANALGNAVALGQNSVPHIESGKHYVLSCYAKGTGYLAMGAGVSSFVNTNIYLDNVTAWTRYEFPIVLPHISAYMNVNTNKANVFFGVTGVDADISICALKMEEGITASEWRLAVEDLEDALTDFITGEYADDLEEVSKQIDKKAETWYQSTDPSSGWSADEKAEHVGDLWFKTTDSTTWRWNGTKWVEQTAPDEVFDKIDGKAQIFTSQPTPPYFVGDLWFNSASSDIMTCIKARATGNYTASEWQKRNKYTDDTYTQNWIANTYATDKNELIGQIDKKIETWYQSSDPSSAWTTTALKNAHTGDLWYNTSTTGANAHVTKRWSGTAWVAQDVPKAVFDEIDGKAAIWYGTPSGTYTGVAVGDYLVDSTTGSTYRYATSGWVKMTDYQSAIDALDIGGRNLLLNTATASTFDLAITAGKFAVKDFYGLIAAYNKLKLVANDYITMSFDWSATGVPSGTVTVRIGTNLTPYEYFGTVLTLASGSSSGHVEKTFKITSALVNSAGTTFRGRIDSSVDVSAGALKFTISNAKLEKGSKATDWTPAPEDVDSAINALDTSFNQEKVFNRLTNNGQTQGIYLENGKLYLNFTYGKGGTLKLGGSDNVNGLLQVLNASGNVITTLNNEGINTTSLTASNYVYVNGGTNSYFKIPTYSDSSEYVEISSRNLYVRGSSKYVSISTNNRISPIRIHSNSGSSYYMNLDTSGLQAVDSSDYAYCKTDGVYPFWVKVGSNANIHYSSVGQLYVSGTFLCTSTKSRIVETEDYADRTLYCYETPSPLFGDIGEGIIGDDGRCYVWIDAIFAETISTNQYQVFLQKYGDGECWIAERTPNYFVVEGTNGLSFGWELKAKQSDFDQLRLDKFIEDEAEVMQQEDYGKNADYYIQELKEGRLSE